MVDQYGSNPTPPVNSGDDLKQATDTLKHDAKAATDTLKHDFADLKHEAQAELGELAEHAKGQLDDAAAALKGMAGEQKAVLSQQIAGVAQAMSKAADELDTQQASSAGLTRSIADTMQKFSDTIENRDVGDLVSMAQDFGRRQPVAFMGAAMLAGFVASRFLVATSNRSQPPQNANTASAYQPNSTVTQPSGSTYGSDGTRQDGTRPSYSGASTNGQYGRL